VERLKKLEIDIDKIESDLEAALLEFPHLAESVNLQRPPKLNGVKYHALLKTQFKEIQTPFQSSHQHCHSLIPSYLNLSLPISLRRQKWHR